MEPRVITALALMAGTATTLGTYAAFAWRKARADRRRRRGIKDYNSPRAN